MSAFIGLLLFYFTNPSTRKYASGSSDTYYSLRYLWQNLVIFLIQCVNVLFCDLVA